MKRLEKEFLNVQDKMKEQYLIMNAGGSCPL